MAAASGLFYPAIAISASAPRHTPSTDRRDSYSDSPNTSAGHDQTLSLNQVDGMVEESAELFHMLKESPDTSTATREDYQPMLVQSSHFVASSPVPSSSYHNDDNLRASSVDNNDFTYESDV